MFETEREVLAWYESRPRALSAEFINSIKWDQIKNYPIGPAFLPILIYMRDVEFFTDIYYKGLLRTPTGKDPIIRRFMDRWSVEELQHAELLNRFLEEADVPTDSKWQQQAKAKIPRSFTVGSYLTDHAAKPFGRYFHAVPMVWGAINEMSTLQGYHRLATLAGHPVLRHLLTGVMREEAIHSTFYWNLARLKLGQARFSRFLARFLVEKLWAPVGQGAKPKHEADYVVATLFSGPGGLEIFERAVTRRIEQLPGFAAFKNLSNKIVAIVQGHPSYSV